MTDPSMTEPVRTPDYPHPRWRLALLSFLLALSVIASVGGWMDQPARELNDTALKRALVTFAVARTLNGVISMAQGTEVAVQPAGVGVNLAPGELLDPVNDLVESFSAVMLYASVALGTQKLLLGLSDGVWWSVLLGLLSFWYIGLALRGAPMARPLGRWLLAFWLARFAVPLITVGTEAAFHWFLQPEYERSSTELGVATERMATLQAQEAQALPAPDEGFLDRAGRWWDSTKSSFDISARLEALKEAATTAISNMITLIVVFLLQTVAIPSALLWFGWAQVRRRV